MLTFSFHPVWPIDAATKAATALQKAQATGIYAGLGLWSKAVMAGLVAGQLAEDGIYPDAAAAFAAAATEDPPQPVEDYSPDQPRDPQGRWSEGGGSAAPSRPTSPSAGKGWQTTLGHIVGAIAPISSAEAAEIDPEEEREKEETGGSPPATEEQQIPKLRPTLGPKLQESEGAASILPTGGGALQRSGVSTAKATSTMARSVSAAETTSPAMPPWARQLDLPGIVGPGPYAHEPIPISLPGKISPLIQMQNTHNGYRWGCHRCGSNDPGSMSGHFYLDHQIPTALNGAGFSQFLYPHCRDCSNLQGGIVSGLKRKGYPR